MADVQVSLPFFIFWPFVHRSEPSRGLSVRIRAIDCLLYLYYFFHYSAIFALAVASRYPLFSPYFIFHSNFSPFLSAQNLNSKRFLNLKVEIWDQNDRLKNNRPWRAIWNHIQTLQCLPSHPIRMWTITGYSKISGRAKFEIFKD